MKGALLLYAAMAGVPAGAATAPACGAALRSAAALLAQGDGALVAFVPRPLPVPVGRHFELRFAVCGDAGPRSDVKVQVDADMPAHRHGMNYRASVVPLGAGVFRAQGLMFHMPGRWRVIFDIEADGRMQRATHEIEVQ